MDIFLLKKIISVLIMPINIVLILLILSVLYFHKRPRVSFKYLLSALLLLVVSSIPALSDRFMVGELPDILVEKAKFLLCFQKILCIYDSCSYL